MKIIFSIPICMLILLSACIANAQLSVECAGKAYFIPKFRNDFIPEYYPQEQFEGLHILEPIQTSKYSLELRAYYSDARINTGSAVVIYGDNERLFGKVYEYRLQNENNYNDTVPPKGFIIIKNTKWKRNIYCKVKSFEVPDTLLQSLINNHLFDLPDIMVIRDSLKRNNIQLRPTNVLDDYTMILEIKLKDKYRSFSCDPIWFEANKQIPALNAEALICNAFDKMYTTAIDGHP